MNTKNTKLPKLSKVSKVSIQASTLQIIILLAVGIYLAVEYSVHGRLAGEIAVYGYQIGDIWLYLTTLAFVIGVIGLIPFIWATVNMVRSQRQARRVYLTWLASVVLWVGYWFLVSATVHFNSGV